MRCNALLLKNNFLSRSFFVEVESNNYHVFRVIAERYRGAEKYGIN